MRWVVVGISLFVSLGCLPDLSPWTVERPDGGPRPRFDAGPVPDGWVPPDRPPVDDCRAPTPLGQRYFEDFEGGFGGWGVTTETPEDPSSWTLGAPAGEILAGAASGRNAWATALVGEYPANEESFVVSPCFDASSAAHDLLITLQRAYSTEQCCDRATLEYSVDGGVTWAAVMGERRLGFEAGGAWSGESAWGRAAALLPGTAGQPRVQVRIRFHSDSSAQGEGFAFDDVEIRPSSVDLTIALEEAPRCGHALATVTNVGGQPATGFDVSWNASGTTGTVPFSDTLAYDEAVTLEVGGPLATQVMANVFDDRDENRSNDAATFSFRSTPFGSAAWGGNFEANDGGLVVMGEPSSWEWGVPAGAFISSAASGTRAWVTNLDGDYGRSEQAGLTTPCFDMRALSRDPELSFSRVYDTESCCDWARVEVSIDGAPFETLGNSTSGGTNWYTSSSGWRGSSGSGTWTSSRHPLTGARGSGAVRVRIFFRSDGSQEGEGFGVDDFWITP